MPKGSFRAPLPVSGWIFYGVKEYSSGVSRQYLALAAGVVAVSFAAVFIRLAEAPPLVIAAYRMCLAALILLPLAATRARAEIRRLTRREVLLVLLAGGFLALHFGLWITSLSYTSVATSVVLVTINPVFVALLSRCLFGERLARQTIAGIVICFLGAAVIAYQSWEAGGEAVLGGALSLAGALAAAGYLLAGRRLRGVEPVATTTASGRRLPIDSTVARSPSRISTFDFFTWEMRYAWKSRSSLLK